MTRITTDIKRHCVFRAYIALARGEHFTPQMDMELTEASVEFEVQIFSAINWFVDKRLTEAISEMRGLTIDEQFEKGIIRTPSQWRNRYYCRRLAKAFGSETVTECFGGEYLKYERWHDFIFPVRKGTLIERFAFYTMREMQQWGIKQAA